MPGCYPGTLENNSFQSSNTATELCILQDEWRPAFWTALAVSGGKNCDVHIGNITSNGVKQVKLLITPWNNIGTDPNIYISGVYPLDSSSPLYIHNASTVKTLGYAD